MSEATKRNLLPIHIIIMFALIIGFHLCLQLLASHAKV